MMPASRMTLAARPGPCAYTFQQCGLGDRLNGCGPHGSRSTRRYRCSQSRTSSFSSKPIPASTILLPQEPGQRHISSANCSAAAGTTNVFDIELFSKMLGQLLERVPFDPYKDFDPVTLAVTSPDMGQGAKAAPDGYTLLVAGTPIVINPTLYGPRAATPPRRRPA